VVNNQFLYSRGTSFISRPGGRLSWLKFFVFFVSPSRQFWVSTLKIRLWSLPSRSFSYSSFTYRSFIRFSVVLVTEKSSLNKLK
jgi:hypothetical protein